MSKLYSRRSLLTRSAQFCLGAAAATAIAGTSAADKVCADPEEMDSGQKGMRDSLNYTEASPDPSKTCSGCGFFQATEGGCGSCMIFNGGPVNAKGHCDSWSEKS